MVDPQVFRIYSLPRPFLLGTAESMFPKYTFQAIHMVPDSELHMLRVIIISVL
ncbi:hypothetical protein ARMSODRAFT_470435 [Armillaria solidipes]|uniref:Uncharacterized protein n=1 Tax=Armillaria solidipes TaxID=1076256 RepID=A0A2H3B0C4_9AGAR|nr:hypothetical protein ARMSODRAFT_470435 [Armillaria solidipes]